MQIKKVLVMGIRILTVCLVFAVCFAAGVALSGLDRIAQQAPPSQQAVSPQPPPSPQTAPRQQPAPAGFFLPFLVFCVCAGVVVSYLILRSSWHGWTLAGAIFVGIYGIVTVASQIESVFLLSNKLPHGMIRAMFVQGAIATLLFAPLAVLVLGKWRAASPAPASPAQARMRASAAAWRVALLVVAFVFLYMFFGYYVAWRSPAVRQYYGGPEIPTFLGVLKHNWLHFRWIYPLQVFRALLYTAFLFPLVRMLRAARWETALAMALFLSVWTTMLLLPNPIMPPSVAHTHFWETLAFSLVFGSLLGWLMSTPPSATNKSAPVAS